MIDAFQKTGSKINKAVILFAQAKGVDQSVVLLFEAWEVGAVCAVEVVLVFREHSASLRFHLVREGWRVRELYFPKDRHLRVQRHSA